MVSINKSVVAGNVGKSPDIRATKSGKSVANFSIATQRNIKQADGSYEVVTEWHAIIAYERLADLVQKYVDKGAPLYVEGRLTYRDYKKQDGTPGKATEIIASDIQLLRAKEKTAVEEMGLSRSRPELKPLAPMPKSTTGSGFDDLDDDVPF